MIRVVIVGGDSPRSKNLRQDLEDSGYFQVEIQPRILPADLDEFEVVVEPSDQNYGRQLSLTERCCALAHRRAQEKIRSVGGVILEDDAFVLDVHVFAAYASWAVEGNKGVLLNLSTSNCAEDVAWELKNNRLVRTCGPSALAVGYAASSEVLRKLIDANLSLQYVADWPPVKANHFRLKFPVIAHGRRDFESLIAGTTFRDSVPLVSLLLKFQFGTFVRRLIYKSNHEITKLMLKLAGAKS